MASAFVMMTTGDLLAQELEFRQQRKVDGESIDSLSSENSSGKSKISRHANAFGYYSYSMSNDPSHWETSLHDHNVTLHDWEDKTSISPTHSSSDQSSHTTILSILTHWDSFRTAAMGFWALFLITPFFVKLFRWYERNLPPSTTLRGIVSRVGISFIVSIPVNLAFFAFHSWARYTMECCCSWPCYSLLSEPQKDHRHSPSLSTSTPLHYSWSEASHRIWTKWQAEMPFTTQMSFQTWVPFNFVNFSITPIPWRPVTQCAAGVAWNCFLSLAQHRTSDMDHQKELTKSQDGKDD